MGLAMASPQEERLLGNHLFIVPELNPVKSRLLEETVAKTKGDADDFKGIANERNGSCSCAKHDLTGVRMENLDTSISRPATFRQLEENDNLAITKGKRRLLQGVNGTDQAQQASAGAGFPDQFAHPRRR
jgi:hypothetical protein